MTVLPTVRAIRYVAPLREGGSLPGLMEADDEGTYVVKYRGAGQGPKALVAEVVAGEIGRALGLPVPEAVLLGARHRPSPAWRWTTRSATCCATSEGLNYALDYLPGSITYDPLVPPAPEASSPPTSSGSTPSSPTSTAPRATPTCSSGTAASGSSTTVPRSTSTTTGASRLERGDDPFRARAAARAAALRAGSGRGRCRRARGRFSRGGRSRRSWPACPRCWLARRVTVAKRPRLGARALRRLPDRAARGLRGVRGGGGSCRALLRYDYAVVRVVPDVARGEFVNAGVILFAKSHQTLLARVALDEARLLALATRRGPRGRARASRCRSNASVPVERRPDRTATSPSPSASTG